MYNCCKKGVHKGGGKTPGLGKSRVGNLWASVSRFSIPGGRVEGVLWGKTWFFTGILTDRKQGTSLLSKKKGFERWGIEKIVTAFGCWLNPIHGSKKKE